MPTNSLHRGPTAVEVVDLRKTYGKVRALDGIDLAVQPGEIFGLLGHNGAGKTTTIRILTGRARPSSGTARVVGFELPRERARIKPFVNAVFEVQNVYERLTGYENLVLFARLYRCPAGRAHEMLERVGICEADGKRRVKDYSTGMKQRLLIARALLNRPRVLFCDEPTRGLDPLAARELRTILAETAGEGTTVFLTTHDMEDADQLCDRVAFLSDGRIVALDTPRELKLRYGERMASVLLDDRTEHTLALDDPADAERLHGWMRDGRVLTVHSREGSLEDVFVDLAGRPL